MEKYTPNLFKNTEGQPLQGKAAEERFNFDHLQATSPTPVTEPVQARNPKE